jgi:tetratricopeptide (TPR) repeat protein
MMTMDPISLIAARARAMTARASAALAFGVVLASGAITHAQTPATQPAGAAKAPVAAPAPGTAAAKVTVPAAATTSSSAAIPSDCSQTADKAKAVVACSTYIKDLGKAGQKDNDRMATVLSTRAAAYSGQGLHKAALTDITRALYHLPKDAKLWHQRGQIRQALGQHFRCAADFSIALKHDPKMAQAYVGRGDCYRRLGALPKAIADSDEALKLDPKSAAALSTRAYAQLRLGKNDRALADAEDAIKADPNSARGYLTRGLAQEKTDKAKADADVKRVLELDPKIKAEAGLPAILKRFGQ